MKITRTTLYKDCAYFVTEDHFAQVKKLVNAEDLHDYETLVSLPLGEFLKVIKGDKDLIMKLFFKDENFTFWEFCKRLKWLDLEVEKIKKIFDSFKLKQSDEEKKASVGIDFLPFEIEIQCYCIDKFNLHNFTEASQMKTSEVLVMKKRDVNNAKYERNLRQIYAKK